MDVVLRNFLGRDSFTGAAVFFGHCSPHSSFSLPCLHPVLFMLQHSSASSEAFQTTNQAENHSLFFVARFTVLRDGKVIETSFRASSTIPTVLPYQKSDFKPSFIDLQRENHYSI